MTEIDWMPIGLSMQLAALTTAILFILGLPLSYMLAYSRFRGRAFLEALVSLPLVLPPTVIGFYLLLFFSPSRALGSWLRESLGMQLIFSFEGLIVASVLYSLPFMVQPLQSGFRSVPKAQREAALLMGKSRVSTLFFVLLPQMRVSLLTGAVLTFAHTLGEFGVVLMIGGNLPGETRVASIALYDRVEAMDYGAAHTYALVLLTLTFVILLSVYSLNASPEAPQRRLRP